MTTKKKTARVIKFPKWAVCFEGDYDAELFYDDKDLISVYTGDPGRYESMTFYNITAGKKFKPVSVDNSAKISEILREVK